MSQQDAATLNQDELSTQTNQGFSGDSYEAAAQEGLAEAFPNGVPVVSLLQESDEKPEQPQAESETDQPGEDSETELTPDEIAKKLTEDETASESDDGESEQPEGDSKEAGDKTEFVLQVNGEEVKKSLTQDEIVAELQKAHTFTQNSQALKVEAQKAKESLEAYEKEIEEGVAKVLTESQELKDFKETFESFLEHKRRTDPDWFADFESERADFEGQFTNPIIKKQLEAINTLRAELENTKKTQETASKEAEDKARIEAVQADYAKGIQSIQRHLPVLKDLGITFSEDQIKARFIEKGDSVEEAFNAIYQPLMNKALRSKLKVVTTNGNATRGKNPTVGARGMKGKQAIQSVHDKKTEGMSVQEIADYYTFGEGQRVFQQG